MSVGPIARPAEASDLPELSAFLIAATEEQQTQRGGAAHLASFNRVSPAIEVLERAFHDTNTMVWCGVWEQLVVGYAIAVVGNENDDVIVTITDLYTTPEARDIGVGEVLLEAAVAWAIALDASAIDAHALPGARESKNLYERLGLTARLITVRRDLR